MTPPAPGLRELIAKYTAWSRDEGHNFKTADERRIYARFVEEMTELESELKKLEEAGPPSYPAPYWFVQQGIVYLQEVATWFRKDGKPELAKSCDSYANHLRECKGEAALAAQHAPLKYPEKCPTCGVQAQPGSFDMGFAPFPAQREMTDEEKANLTHYYKKRRASSPSKEGGRG